MVNSTEDTSLKILGKKLILNKKPSGPGKETMIASIIEVGAEGTDPKKMTYVVQYFQKPFNINKALRASPDEIKKMSKEQITSRIKKYVLGNLGLHSGSRKEYHRYPSISAAKAGIKELARRLQAK